MERKAKVSFEFRLLNPTQKILFGDNVVAEMTANAAVFPLPDVSLAALSAANEALKLKTQQALSGDKVAIQERDEAEQTWQELFKQEAYYVQRVALGSKLTIAQSGFGATRTEVVAVPAPGQARIAAWANRGRGSGIHVEVERIAACRVYVFVLSTEPLQPFARIQEDTLKLLTNTATIELKMTTKRKIDFKPLTSGQLYYVSAYGFNASGMGALANVIDVVAP
jgi:hypothetical protein